MGSQLGLDHGAMKLEPGGHAVLGSKSGAECR